MNILNVLHEYSKLEIYTGPNSAEKFMEYFESKVHRIYKLQKIMKKNVHTFEAIVMYVKIYLQRLIIKSCDHNYLTGKYRGAAHNKCN